MPGVATCGARLTEAEVTPVLRLPPVSEVQLIMKAPRAVISGSWAGLSLGVPCWSRVEPADSL